MKSNPERGFIALFSVLVLSAVLLLLSATADYAAYLAHEAVSDELSYRTAQQGAFSCARLAASRLDADPARFLGVGTTSIQLLGGATCDIVSASTTADSASVLSQGNSGGSSVLVYFTADRASSTAPFVLRAWTEN